MKEIRIEKGEEIINLQDLSIRIKDKKHTRLEMTIYDDSPEKTFATFNANKEDLVYIRNFINRVLRR